VAKLVVFRGDTVEKEIPIKRGTLRIGRGDRNDVVLDDSSNGVSRFHAEIRFEGNHFVIIDTNSRNGVWISGRRIKQKATLELGVPVTIGGFELALEDDVPSGQFELPPVGQPTIATANTARSYGAGVAQTSRGAQSSTSSGAGITPRTRQVLLWAGAAATVLVICIATYEVIRHRSRPAPVVARVEEPKPTVDVQPTETPQPTPEEQERTTEIANQLKEAGDAMAARDYAGAIARLNRVLELDPDNEDAQHLKEEAVRASAVVAPTVGRTPRPAPPPEVPAEPETPGIPRGPNENSADYTARVNRVQSALREGRNALDKGDYAAALTQFRAVERDQPKYQGVDQLILETLKKQQADVEKAIISGDQNAQAGKLHDARLWYQRALAIDRNSTSAREKEVNLQGRMSADAQRTFDQAGAALKTGEKEIAARLYQQIVEQLLPGDGLYEQAKKQLGTLKP
jgi:tetratricopeptide (TPR) repeat protein